MANWRFHSIVSTDVGLEKYLFKAAQNKIVPEKRLEKFVSRDVIAPLSDK